MLDATCSATSKINDYSNISEVHVQKDPDFKVVPCVEISPSKCVEIKGDGNCLFRAISAAVTGKENDHRAVRLAIINFMTASQNSEKFSKNLLPSYYAVEQYLSSSRMDIDRTWGTDVEISVAATMLQVTIYVFTFRTQMDLL